MLKHRKNTHAKETLVPHSIYLLSTMLLATAAMATQLHHSKPGMDHQPSTAQPRDFRAFATSGETRTPIFTSETTVIMSAPQQRWVF